MFDTIAFAVKTFSCLQNVEIYGLNNFIDNVKDNSVITIANHQSYIDDPIIWTPLYNKMMNYNDFRYTIAARENFEGMKWPSIEDMKLLLVNRRNTNNDKTNSGLNQECFYRANEILIKDNGWIHIFPEGKIIQECGSLIGTFKPGVSHLLMTCDNDLRKIMNDQLGAEFYKYSGDIPMLIPVAHFGMHNILPIHQSPNIGQNIHVFYGYPINIKDILKELKMLPITEIRKILTTYIEQQYLQFYLNCFNKLFKSSINPNEIIRNNNGYYHHIQGPELFNFADKMIKVRLKLKESPNDDKILEEYISLLRHKECYLLTYIIKENVLTTYNSERLQCNLFSVRKSLTEAYKKLISGCLC